MTLPVERPIVPMLSRAAPSLPAGPDWLYEPKWDGFRALIYRDGESVHIMSRNGHELTPRFGDVAEAARAVLPERSVFDGELIALDPAGRITFEGLQARLNPDPTAARGTVRYVAFDLLGLGKADLRSKEFWQRRRLLEQELEGQHHIDTTPQTGHLDSARTWLRNFQHRGIEGVVAKQRNLLYTSGARLMVKVRARHSLDCVIGGFVPGRDGKPVVLLLGLYGEDGLLDHVGQTSVLAAPVAREAWRRLKPNLGGQSFAEGRLPGYSRWQEQRPSEWVSVEPVVVCEVAYSAIDNFRLRHGASFLRWRDDRHPGDC